LVGVKKEKFTIKDVYNIYGYMSFSLLWLKKQTRYWLTFEQIRNGIFKIFGLDGSFNRPNKKMLRETGGISPFQNQ
jgi:penicillin amidase